MQQSRYARPPSPRMPSYMAGAAGLATGGAATASIHRNAMMSHEDAQYYNDIFMSSEEREMDERITLITQYMRLCKLSKSQSALSAMNDDDGDDMDQMSVRRKYVIPGVPKFSDEELEMIPLARLKFTVYRLKRVRRLDTGVTRYKEWIVSSADIMETVIPFCLGLFLPRELQLQLQGFSQRTESILRSGTFDEELEVLYHRNSQSGPSNPYATIILGLGGLILRTHVDNVRNGNVKDHAFEMRDGTTALMKMGSVIYSMFSGKGTGGPMNPISMMMNFMGGAGSSSRMGAGVEVVDNEAEEKVNMPQAAPTFASQAEAASALKNALNAIN